jgi:hypothetical protein
MKNLFNFSKSISPLVIIYLIISSFPFLGTQCNTLINGQISGVNELAYTWTLVRQTGSNIDVCPGETVKFDKNYYARLVCPGQDTTVRKFSLESDNLTYYLNNTPLAEYRFEVVKENGDTKLNMYGTNVNRNLFYLRTGDAPSEQNIKKSDNNTHSSD